MSSHSVEIPGRNIIDADKPLSQSIIWEMQRRYFLQNGMRAWQDDVVPHQISCSPYMARAYAQIIRGFVSDCLGAAEDGHISLDIDQPLYVIELGAGSGRLSHHLLHQLDKHDVNLSTDPLCLKFVLTDFVPETINFWQNHPQLRPWVDRGLLDFALFDAIDPQPLHLIESGRLLAPNQSGNPLIILANYFFDSIPQDSFVIRGGNLFENRLTVSSQHANPSLADPAVWEHLQLHYEAVPIDIPPYPDENDRGILHNYAANLGDTVLSFPNVGTACLRFWQQYGSGRALWLTSDRGYTLAESLIRQDDPLPNLHGSFSLMVNYHALGSAVLQAGGAVLHAPHYQDNMQTLAFITGNNAQNCADTRTAFDRAIVQQGPDDFFALKKRIEAQFTELPLSEMLSFIRLSAFDGELFSTHFESLLGRVQAADPVWYPDVAQMAVQVLEQYLPLREDDPLQDQVEKLLAIMGFERE
ncbi:MAG: hypothetical protein QNJ45_11475 [Ardenticatenaceae bacterium]|nr:hypothetical protein [Ardenticatenaceae bacterium]